ncbi:MAG: type VI secretion system baseplate subunit TssE [Nitrospiria bacterium]
MAELSQQERLQPALLDRLTDDAPDQKRESPEKRVMPMRRLREIVLRDLTWLLNSGNLSGVHDFSDYPFVAESVLNYGMPDLAGFTVSSLDRVAIERYIIKVIRGFEPRILQKSLKVHVISAEDQMNHNAITLEIRGDLWAQPLPMHLYLRTEIDLEGGTVKIVET